MPNLTCAGTLFVSLQLRGDTTIQTDNIQKEYKLESGFPISKPDCFLIVVSFPVKNLVDSSVPLQTLALVT